MTAALVKRRAAEVAGRAGRTGFATVSRGMADVEASGAELLAEITSADNAVVTAIELSTSAAEAGSPQQAEAPLLAVTRDRCCPFFAMSEMTLGAA